MKTFGLAVLSVALWWLAAFSMLFWPSLARGGSAGGDWMVAIPVVMIFGSMYAVPMAIYLASIDGVARRFKAPLNLPAFGIGVAVWVWGVLGLAASLNNPAMARETATEALWASVPGAALFLLRQLSASVPPAGIRSH
jgi:hypothetical protein